MKKLIVCLVMLCATMAYATNDDVVNSQMYVDNAVGNLQTNLPAKTSDKVVTYTTTAGTTGERDIKTTLGNESTNTSDTGIPTTGTVNTAVGDKQDKLEPLSNVNIVTYSGTANNESFGRGLPTTTPIYDSTVNTFDNGLVRAKTLNDAVIAGVNAEATKITTDPKGALWVFNRTPPKVLPTTANLPANSTGDKLCYVTLVSGGPSNNTGCSTTLYSTFSRGDWGATFIYNTGITYDNDTCTGDACYKEVYGITACIDSAYGDNYQPVPSTETTLINKLESAYTLGKTGVASGKYCFGKLVNPVVANSHWVYFTEYNTTDECAADCAYRFAALVWHRQQLRSAVFGAVPVSAQ